MLSDKMEYLEMQFVVCVFCLFFLSFLGGSSFSEDKCILLRSYYSAHFRNKHSKFSCFLGSPSLKCFLKYPVAWVIEK